MSWTLIPLFALTALFYAAVGFGGGSTYNALLVLSGTDFQILPAIALACNIIVVTGGVVRFGRAGYLEVQRLIPFLITSVPAAWFGGRLMVSEGVFIGLLGGVLLLSGLRLWFQKPDGKDDEPKQPRRSVWPVGLLVGGGIGFLAGLVGIGGGIFLAPILYLMRWGAARQIAAACSLFILVNSMAGLAGQLSKLSDMAYLQVAVSYWPLLLAVLIGGQIGSWFGAGRLQPYWMRRMTAILILYVAMRLLWRLVTYVAIWLVFIVNFLAHPLHNRFFFLHYLQLERIIAA